MNFPFLTCSDKWQLIFWPKHWNSKTIVAVLFHIKIFLGFLRNGKKNIHDMEPKNYRNTRQYWLLHEINLGKKKPKQLIPKKTFTNM